MEQVNLLVVERDADWTQWAQISRALSDTVLVLIQQADETMRAFQERVAERIERAGRRALGRVVVLRSRASKRATDPAHDQLLRELRASANGELRVYPFASEAPATASLQ